MKAYIFESSIGIVCIFKIQIINLWTEQRDEECSFGLTIYKLLFYDQPLWIVHYFCLV